MTSKPAMNHLRNADISRFQELVAAVLLAELSEAAAGAGAEALPASELAAAGAAAGLLPLFLKSVAYQPDPLS